MRALMIDRRQGSQGWVYLARLLEILPGLSVWLFLLSPIILSFIEPVWVAYIIIGYDLLWLSKNFGNAGRLVRGYARMRRTIRVDWHKRFDDLSDPGAALLRVKTQLKNPRLSLSKRLELREYRRWLRQIGSQPLPLLDPRAVYNVAMIALSIEPIEVIEPSVQFLLKSHHDLKKIWLVIAYEARGGARAAKTAHALVKRYGKQFGYAVAIEHPDNMAGEIVAKAGNVTFAARYITEYVRRRGIDPGRVLVTTLDSDNRPHPEYFSLLTFTYCASPERIHKSYQPLPMFLNNIWDVPAAMRVVASWNSFWILSEAMRPHRLRNFSSHAQSLQTLIDTDYWNVRSIVEDGHQFWRTYYRYHGNHQAVPLYVPVYQDAVLTNNYLGTFKAQFKQLQRWAWGASDISFVFVNNLRHREIHWPTKWWYFFRLYEGHFTWATAPLILAFAAWLPLLLNPGFSDQVIAHQLPIIASRIQTVAMVGALATVLISWLTLPPRPARYKRRHHLMMFFQWALLPFVAIGIHSAAAINAQTRLMIGKYIERFNVTEKAVKK